MCFQNPSPFVRIVAGARGRFLGLILILLLACMRSIAWTGQRAVSPLLFRHPPRRASNLTIVKCCRSSGKNEDMDFRVATYNILCSHLAEPTRFPECSPRNLDALTRLNRIKHKLGSEMSKGSIICLQEVGLQWAGDLHVFFMSRGYSFVTAHYGARFNNYMGVALAWPLDKYDCLTVDTTRLSETRMWGKEPAEVTEEREAKRAAVQAAAVETPGVPKEGGWGGPLGFLARITGRGVKRPSPGSSEGVAVETAPREPENPWQIAERRFNQILFARLRVKSTAGDLPNGGSFCVGTYHMPCLFKIRPVMVMHTSMAIKHLAKLAGSDPLVFAGDFNFNPDSDCYKLVVEGDLSESSESFPVRPEWEKGWSPKTGVSLESAYRQVDGKEPDFTNNAKVADWDPFIDTLDYIFHTPGITATKVLPLEHRSNVKGPFPNSEEPSDHVLLAAEYRMDRPPTDGA